MEKAMSYEIPTDEQGIQNLIKYFIAESTQILDESVSLTRRIALLYKWSWVLHGLGYPEPLETTELSEDEIRAKISDMLKWVAIIISNKR